MAGVKLKKKESYAQYSTFLSKKQPQKRATGTVGVGDAAKKAENPLAFSRPGV